MQELAPNLPRTCEKERQSIYAISLKQRQKLKDKDAEKTADITKETTEQPLTSSSFSVPSDYGNQFLNLSHNKEIFEQPLVLQQTTPIPTTITTPPINTEAPAITTAILEITLIIALQLRVVKLKQDMSEVKKIDHSTAILASIQSKVPLVIDKYVGTKLDDALLKALERHTVDLVEKYYVLPIPESSKKQEYKKSPEEIIRIKREQEEKKQDATYTIKSTDKAALDEFDLKTLIEDENAMDKEVADTGKSTKKKRKRESESTKKSSTTKEFSKGKDPKVGFKTGKSAPAKDPVEEPTDKVIMDEQPTKDILISDEGHVLDPEDTDNAHMPKISDTTTWFRPKPKEERPASPEPEWVIPLIDLPKADNNWANAFAKAHQDPDENKLHNKVDDIGSFIRWYCRRIGKEELSKADLEGPTFMMIDLVNPEGHRIVPDISNTIALKENLQVRTYERYGYNYLREIVLRRADYNEYKISEKDFKSLHPNDFEDLNILYIQGKLDHYQAGKDASDFPFKEDYTIVFKPRAVIYRDRDDNRKMMRIDKVHKFSDGTLTRIKEKLDFDGLKKFQAIQFNKWHGVEGNGLKRQKKE
ncbi:hypothetical protein Tco_1554966 [Tanacetum coccineum]